MTAVLIVVAGAAQIVAAAGTVAQIVAAGRTVVAPIAALMVVAGSKYSETLVRLVAASQFLTDSKTLYQILSGQLKNLMQGSSIIYAMLFGDDIDLLHRYGREVHIDILVHSATPLIG